MALTPGDPAPLFVAPSANNPRYNFIIAGGRYLVMAFMPTLNAPEAIGAMEAVRANRALFDDVRFSFFGALRENDTFAAARNEMPGIRWLHDVEGAISTHFQLAEPAWVVIDPSLRVLFTLPLRETAQVMARIALLPEVDDHAGVPLHAPVLIAPRIFEPGLCRALIDLYERNGGEPTGFMREIDGKTVMVKDLNHKRRSDVILQDPLLMDHTRARIQRRLVPLIKHAFQYEATRMERYLIACYDSASGGWFRPHRDNTTSGTAHRKFAVSINLNAEEHEGGELRFPEFGRKTYRPPTGGAVVFSCSLLHEATPVTRGKRYAFLPFLYDDEGAKLREANNAFLAEGTSRYEPNNAESVGQT